MHVRAVDRGRVRDAGRAHGADRELAEEFIEQTMDPNLVMERTMSGNESEAW